LDIDEVMKEGLHEFIDHFQCKLNAIGDAVHEMFFQVQPQ
jgi:uncharacterized alpha-E superfamily protein